MRKYYIDNLRNLTILLLFPVHTFMIWNNFGTKFNIWVEANTLLSTLIVLVNPWFMPILFVLAGLSARYSLEKRTVREFVLQRVAKLLIPFIGGMILFIPIQGMYARKYFYHYQGGILDNFRYFYTHLTDFSGYDGSFSPGHLWFILFLFLISLISLVIFKILPYEKMAVKVEKINMIGIVGIFIPIWLMYYLGNFGGYSIGKNLALYLAGYYVLGNGAVMDKLEKNRKWLTALYVISTAVLLISYYKYSYYGDLLVTYIGWNAILVFMIWGKRYLNKKTGFTEYFNKASYPVYILHQPILIALAYYVLKICDNLLLQAAGICFGSFILTIAAYQLIGLIPYLRKLVGMK